MLKSKELRVKAWNSLKGKYWKAFIVLLVLGILASIGTSLLSGGQTMMTVVNSIDPSKMDSAAEIGAKVVGGAASAMTIIGALISIFVNSAITVGLANFFIKNTYSAPVFDDALSGFKVRYRRNIGALLLASIKVVLWSLLFIIPGIIKNFEYALIPYILADDAEISTKEAFAKSKQMMKGNKWRLFKLELSFFGWFLLCVLTCGIGTYFLIPYVSAASAEFYVELKEKQN